MRKKSRRAMTNVGEEKQGKRGTERGKRKKRMDGDEQREEDLPWGLDAGPLS